MSNENQEHKIPAWLQRIQDNSSELELLISGGAIFGLIQFSNFITNSISILLDILPDPIIPAVFVLIAKISVSCLIIGFIIHVMIRAYWLSLVCLNYVFPQGINWDKLKIKKPYHLEKEQRNDLYSKIIAADKLCGLIMFTCIAASISIFGFALIILPMIAISMYLSYFGEDSLWWDVFGYGFIIPVLAYILDLLLSGLLRKIPYLSYVTYPFFKILDFITLRTIIKKGLWILSSNTSIYKRTIIISILILFSGLYGLETMNKDKSGILTLNIAEREIRKANPIWAYRDNNTFLIDQIYSIESKIISKNFITLQIKYTRRLQNYLESNTELSIKDVYTIKIDNLEIDNFDWSRFKRHKFVKGVELIIPIDNLKKGKHILTIKDKSREVPFFKAGPESEKIQKDRDSGYTEISFWYDKMAATNTSK